MGGCLSASDPITQINIVCSVGYSQETWESSDFYRLDTPELFSPPQLKKSRQLEVSHIRKTFEISVDKVGNLSQSRDLFSSRSSINTETSILFNFTLTEVTSQLFLGSLKEATNGTELLERGITHVISLTGPVPVCLQGNIHAHTHMNGHGKTELKDVVKKLWPIIEESQQKGKALFVYCVNGQNRSAAVMLAIIMKSKGEKLCKAFKLLKSKRPSVGINTSYWKQLLKMEQELFGAHSAPSNRMEDVSCHIKTGKSVIYHDRLSSLKSTSLTESETQKYNWSYTPKEFKSSPTIIIRRETEKSKVRKSSSNRILFSQNVE